MNIEERLAKLERGSRAWRRMALALALIIVVCLICSQATHEARSQTTSSGLASASQSGQTLDQIRAKSLEIVDDKGQRVALLTGTSDGGAVLFVSAREHFGSAYLMLGPDGPKWRIVGEGGAIFLSHRGIAIRSDESVAWRQSEALAKKIELGTLSAEEAAQVGKLQIPAAVEIGTTTLGGGFVSVYNPLGKRVASMQSSNTNSGVVTVHDVNGEVSNILR
jgi:hypothetical protein